jgi:hypothetical protein
LFRYGFGLVDAGAAVQASLNHVNLPAYRVVDSGSTAVNTPIADKSAIEAAITIHGTVFCVVIVILSWPWTKRSKKKDVFAKNVMRWPNGDDVCGKSIFFDIFLPPKSFFRSSCRELQNKMRFVHGQLRIAIIRVVCCNSFSRGLCT